MLSALLAALVLLVASSGAAQPGSTTIQFGGYTPSTHANLPTCTVTIGHGQVRWVTDLLVDGDCSAGGGTGGSVCTCDEGTWTAGGGSGTDPNAFHGNQSGEFTALPEKVSPTGIDHVVIEDTSASNAKKRVLIANLPSGNPAADSISCELRMDCAHDWADLAAKAPSCTGGKYIHLQGATTYAMPGTTDQLVLPDGCGGVVGEGKSKTVLQCIRGSGDTTPCIAVLSDAGEDKSVVLRDFSVLRMDDDGTGHPGAAPCVAVNTGSAPGGPYLREFEADGFGCDGDVGWLSALDTFDGNTDGANANCIEGTNSTNCDGPGIVLNDVLNAVIRNSHLVNTAWAVDIVDDVTTLLIENTILRANQWSLRTPVNPSTIMDVTLDHATLEGNEFGGVQCRDASGRGTRITLTGRTYAEHTETDDVVVEATSCVIESYASQLRGNTGPAHHYRLLGASTLHTYGDELGLTATGEDVEIQAAGSVVNLNDPWDTGGDGIVFGGTYKALGKITKARGVLHVEDYLAGGTDWGAALQAAYDDCDSLPRGSCVLQLPRQQGLGMVTVPDWCDETGASNMISVIVRGHAPTASFPGSQLALNAALGAGVPAFRFCAEQSGMEDVFLDLNGNADIGVSIYADNATGGANPILNCNNCRLERLRMFDYDVTGIAIESDTTAGGQADNVVIRDSKISGTAATSSDEAVRVANIQAKTFRIVSTDITVGSGSGAAISGYSPLTVESSTIIHGGTGPLVDYEHANRENLSILNSTLEYGSGGAPSPAAIVVRNDASTSFNLDNTVILGNKFNAQGSGANLSHVLIDTAGAVLIQGNHFAEGASVTGTGTITIENDDQATHPLELAFMANSLTSEGRPSSPIALVLNDGVRNAAQQIEPLTFAVQDGLTYAGGICSKAQEAFTITEVSAYVGSAGTSPTTNVEIRSAPNGSPTDVLASPLAMDVDGEFTTTISQAAVAAGEFLCWPALGGTPAAAAAAVTVHGVR